MENKTKQSIVMLLSLALMACNTVNVPINNNIGITTLQSNLTKNTPYVINVSKNKGASFTVNINKPRNGFALKSNTGGTVQGNLAILDHYELYLIENASTLGYPDNGDPISDAVFGPYIINAFAENVTAVKFNQIPPSVSGAYYVAVLAQDSSNNNLIGVNNKSGTINWSGISAGAPYNSCIAVSYWSGIIVASDYSVSDISSLEVTPNFQDGVGVTLETNISVNNGSVPNLTGITSGILPLEFQANSYTTGGQFRPSVAKDGTGNYVVVWESEGSSGSDSDGRSIQGQRYNSSGVPVEAEFQVNTYTIGNQINPSVAMDSTGDFIVVWDSQGSSGSDIYGSGIQGQRYNSSGIPVGAEFQINTFITGNQMRPSVAMDSTGDFVVVWGSYGSSGTDIDNLSIQGQRYASNGSQTGTEFQINTYTIGDQTNPSVSMDSAGDFVVVWESNGSYGNDIDNLSIQGQRYFSAGTKTGTEFQVNTYTTGSQNNPSVAMDGDGDFVVVWESYGSYGTDIDNLSVHGQRYTSKGSPTEAEFQVNTYTTGSQDDPSVAIDITGNFVVTWYSNGSYGTDSDGYSIQGQRYALTGSAIGPEFQVNTYTTDYQGNSTVVMDNNGEFIVVWESYYSNGPDNYYSIQGKRYNR